MHHLSIDIETYSGVDIKKAGLYAYAQAPDFEVLLFAYSLDGGSVFVVDLTAKERIPQSVLNLLFDPGCIKRACNAAFEWYCLSRHFKLEGCTLTPAAWLWQWRCTMLHGQYCGYTAGLGATGEALGLPQDKRKLSTGMALIRTFCVPCKPSKTNGGRFRTRPGHEPERWRLFIEYCAQDVVTEMEIARRLAPYPVPDEVQRQWVTDLTINVRGVAVDMELVRGAITCAAEITCRLTDEAVGLSGLENPGSVAQLSKWLQTELDEDVPDLRKDTVTALLERDLDNDKARRMLEIRQLLGKSSVKKYTAMENAVCADGRLRGMLQFYGANRTGRWAGRIVQPQNLPRTHLPALSLARSLVRHGDLEMLEVVYGNILDTLSQLIRTALVADNGHVLIDADFSAIEARVLAWLAGEEWVLDVFRSHGRIYEATAAQMFGVSIDRIVKGNPEYELRQKGKVATLALGYQGSSGALISMRTTYHIPESELPDVELPDIVRRWRQANRRIAALWYAVERAAVETIRSGKPQGVNGLIFAMEGDASGQYFMAVTLPSGRKLYYVRPSLALNDRGRDSIHYWGLQQTKGGTTKKWQELETYGGKLVENCVQAIARDCLAEGIERLEASGFPVVFHVHDEVVIERPRSADPVTELDEVCRIMGRPIEWAPGLPLKAEGWVDEYFKKD